MTIQEAIGKQFEKTIPEIIKATVNHLLKNKMLDKTISTTIGTTVSTITGNKGSREVIETIPEQSADDENTNVKEIPNILEQPKQTNKKSEIKQKQSSHERHISACTRANGLQTNDTPNDAGGIQQE
eukprot:14015144-Ditylum_brightwellii.AAC.1